MEQTLLPGTLMVAGIRVQYNSSPNSKAEEERRYVQYQLCVKC